MEKVRQLAEGELESIVKEKNDVKHTFWEGLDRQAQTLLQQ